MPNLRSIFSGIAGEKPEPLPHVAVFHEQDAAKKHGRTDDGHSGTVLLRGRLAPEVLTQARRVARMGGISVSAYLAALIMNRPPPSSTDPNGMTDAFLQRVAASPIVQKLDEIGRSIREGDAFDLAEMTTELRTIASTISSGSPLTGESPADEGGKVLNLRVSPEVSARARKEARQFESLSAYLSSLVRYPRQPVPPVEPNVVARMFPFTLAGSRVASAIATVQQRVSGGEEEISTLIPELRAVQRALSDRIVADRPAYDALMDEIHGARDDIAWSAGFLDEDVGGIDEDQP